MAVFANPEPLVVRKCSCSGSVEYQDELGVKEYIVKCHFGASGENQAVPGVYTVVKGDDHVTFSLTCASREPECYAFSGSEWEPFFDRNVGYVRFFLPTVTHIGVWAFGATAIQDLYIPDCVVELEDNCFWCCNVRRVTFGMSPSVERIGVEAFCGSQIEEFYVPDSVRELSAVCFSSCMRLRYVRRKAYSTKSYRCSCICEFLY